MAILGPVRLRGRFVYFDRLRLAHSGTSQTVKIETLAADGNVVTGARCQLTNERNSRVIHSGERVTVHRSGSTLKIECTQPGYAPASGQAISRVNAGMFGNILIGGAIGAMVDSSTGAGFNYPSWMRLVFGETRIFDRRAQTSEQALAGVRIGETRLASAALAPMPMPMQVASAAPAPVEEKSPEPTRPTDGKVSMDDLSALLPAGQ